ncbi:hypothetical protein CIP107510_01939 [Corynebacterium diphtheriae]|nr:hypothetical protein CIP107510_01939 [Corynebacterium diphtheriae]CAB0660634.1 hypothetical protein FRC0016_01807 [Corynebacterium diphtheriae]CAB0810365.1 hypothetical protein FRC0213_01811 [Corynebacterium diphtheriae]CAB0872006.1 hypothetical protein FRC0378_01973 [Corynebacterium diphtheriae]
MTWGGVENDVASGGGIALEAVHVGDGDLIMKLRCDYSAMFANALVFLSGATSRSWAGQMTWSRNTPGCPHVGHSLMESMGSASMTMAFSLGCTVGAWFWGGWFRYPFPAKLRTLVSCATLDPRRANQCTLKPEEPARKH